MAIHVRRWTRITGHGKSWKISASPPKFFKTFKNPFSNSGNPLVADKTDVVPRNKGASFRSIKSLKINIFYIIYNTYKIRYIHSLDGSWPALAHFGAFSWDSFPRLLFRDFAISLDWEALTYSKISPLQFSRVRKFFSKKKFSTFFQKFPINFKKFPSFFGRKNENSDASWQSSAASLTSTDVPIISTPRSWNFQKYPDASQKFYDAT